MSTTDNHQGKTPAKNRKPKERYAGISGEEVRARMRARSKPGSFERIIPDVCRIAKNNCQVGFLLGVYFEVEHGSEISEAMATGSWADHLGAPADMMADAIRDAVERGLVSREPNHRFRALADYWPEVASYSSAGGVH